MNLFFSLVLVCLVLLGALIAWLGDVIGYRLGKSRRSLFGLRPRTTARLIGVVVGAILPLLGLGVAAVGSEQVRTALLHLDDLLARNQHLTYQNEQLTRAEGDLRTKVQKLTSQAAQSEKDAHTAEADASRSRVAAAAANRNLSSARASLSAAQARLRPLQQQRDGLKQQVDKLALQAKTLNASLASSRAEVARVQSEREQVEKQLADTNARLKDAEDKRVAAAGEADRLRADRDKMQGQLQELDHERQRLQTETEKAQRNLADTKTELDASKTRLLQADQQVAEKLAEIDQLRGQFEQALEEQRIVEETPVVVNSGDEIVRIRVSGQQREAQLRAGLAELLVLANNAAARRGVVPQADGRSVLLVRPLPFHAPLNQLPSEEDIIDAVTTRMLQADEESFIVMIRSLERHFAAERRALRVELWFTPDKVRFHKGEVLYTLNFRPKTPGDEVLRAILDVRGHLRDMARARGLVPDPKSGEYGGLSADQVLSALRSISDSKRPVEVDLVVASDIKTADPLAVTLEVRPARAQPTP